MGERIQNGDEIVDDSGKLIGYRDPDGTNRYLVMSSSKDNPLATELAAIGLPILVSNETGLRAALAIPNSKVLQCADVVVNNTLTVETGVSWDLGGFETKQAAGINKSVFVNAAYLRSSSPVTISATAGVATITWASHGLTITDPVSVLGCAEGVFNGVFAPTSVTNNTIVVHLPVVYTGSATGSPVAKRADKNITIKNGTVNYDKTNNPSPATGYATMGGILAHIHNLSFDALEGINAPKYGLLVANISSSELGNISGSNVAAVLQFQTPLLGVKLLSVSGSSSDDLFAITIGDYAAYEVSRGDGRGISIGRIHADSALECFRIAGNSPYRIYDCEIGKMSGSVTSNGWSIRDDTNLTNTLVDSLHIGEVAISSASATNYIPSVGSGMVRSVVIDNFIKLAAASDATLLNGCSVGSFVIKKYVDNTGGTGFGFNHAGSNGSVGYVCHESVEWVAPAGTPSCFVLQATGSAALDHFDVGYVHATGDATGRFITRSGGGSYPNITVRGASGGVNRVYGESGTPSDTCTVSLGNIRGAWAYGAALATSAKVLLNGIVGTFSSAIINAGGTTKTPTIYGENVATTSTHIAWGSNFGRAVGLTLRTDVSKLTSAVQGDVVCDSAAANDPKRFNGAAWVAI